MAKRVGLNARRQAIAAAIKADKGQAAGTPKEGARSPAARPVGLSLRLPPDLHEKVRHIAFNDRVSIHSLILEGVELMIKKRLWEY